MMNLYSSLRVVRHKRPTLLPLTYEKSRINLAYDVLSDPGQRANELRSPLLGVDPMAVFLAVCGLRRVRKDLH